MSSCPTSMSFREFGAEETLANGHCLQFCFELSRVTARTGQMVHWPWSC